MRSAIFRVFLVIEFTMLKMHKVIMSVKVSFNFFMNFTEGVYSPGIYFQGRLRGVFSMAHQERYL